MMKVHCKNSSTDPLLQGVSPAYFFKHFSAGICILTAFQILSSIFILITDEEEVKDGIGCALALDFARWLLNEFDSIYT